MAPEAPSSPQIARASLKVDKDLPDCSIIRLGDNLFAVKKLFSLGKGQTTGLTYGGLRERFLASLGDDPLNHPALSVHDKQESSEQELEEERQMVLQLQAGKAPQFYLDTTMTVVLSASEKVTLISPTPIDECAKDFIDDLGEVENIIVPSLQHWLFAEEWIEQYPAATIYWAPAALGEDLAIKMPSIASRAKELKDKDDRLEPDLSTFLLRGAPLNMNEFVFFHSASNTLITSDAFYGGYRDTEKTTWFQRLWFKLTKGGSYKRAQMPIYRTIRVTSHGSKDDLFDCIHDISKNNIKQIVCAHGTVPYVGDGKDLQKAWEIGFPDTKKQDSSVASHGAAS
mmetsp:Transcript_48465/g.125739  ORF Transcript_48465/g.125739 Transcript_48465/m.125739 type:complete len:341 (-) Transcript_48465:532-1554(-)|eukprot:CAMPEP_0113900632 /NCGR_PEP_ID=MMETSP0780_2-20120614/20790_1 /TAXON_ID=652834 /ORGANISM="Palpitomonas bilix" /LENGTH=340 /DNA_ID=CAMNT_0000893123 /DNA_START=171 /DNA_END=1193 /DNA_ORIENTATION=+ /assembly_acc=CAM_ASM_000599